MFLQIVLLRFGIDENKNGIIRHFSDNCLSNQSVKN